jgi:hypothetical protein
MLDQMWNFRFDSNEQMAGALLLGCVVLGGFVLPALMALASFLRRDSFYRRVLDELRITDLERNPESLAVARIVDLKEANSCLQKRYEEASARLAETDAGQQRLATEFTEHKANLQAEVRALRSTLNATEAEHKAIVEALDGLIGLPCLAVTQSFGATVADRLKAITPFIARTVGQLQTRVTELEPKLADLPSVARLKEDLEKARDEAITNHNRAAIADNQRNNLLSQCSQAWRALEKLRQILPQSAGVEYGEVTGSTLEQAIGRVAVDVGRLKDDLLANQEQVRVAETGKREKAKALNLSELNAADLRDKLSVSRQTESMLRHHISNVESKLQNYAAVQAELAGLKTDANEAWKEVHKADQCMPIAPSGVRTLGKAVETIIITHQEVLSKLKEDHSSLMAERNALEKKTHSLEDTIRQAWAAVGTAMLDQGVTSDDKHVLYAAIHQINGAAIRERTRMGDVANVLHGHIVMAHDALNNVSAECVTVEPGKPMPPLVPRIEALIEQNRTYNAQASKFATAASSYAAAQASLNEIDGVDQCEDSKNVDVYNRVSLLKAQWKKYRAAQELLSPAPGDGSCGTASPSGVDVAGRIKTLLDDLKKAHARVPEVSLLADRYSAAQRYLVSVPGMPVDSKATGRCSATCGSLAIR